MASTLLSLFILLLSFSGISIAAKQIRPRQTAFVNSTAAQSTNVSTATVPPCCWIWAGNNAVKVNTWYNTTISQYTATVVTTFLKYNNTVIPVNSSTIYLPNTPENDPYQDIEYYGRQGPGQEVTYLPGAPTDLIDQNLLMTEGNYGATTVIRPNQTAVTFDFTDLTIQYPTPYAVYTGIEIIVATPSLTAPQTAYDPSLCGTPTTFPYLTYSAGSWNYTDATVMVPSGDLSWSEEVIEGRAPDLEYIPGVIDTIGPFEFAFPLAAPMPNTQVFVDLPDGASSSLIANKTLLAQYPWITNCFTIGGAGEPTVHVQVTQLTSDSSSTITTNAVFTTPSTSKTTPTTTPTTTPVAVPTSTTTAQAQAINASPDTPSAQAPPTITAQAPTSNVQVVPATTSLLSHSVVAVGTTQNNSPATTNAAGPATTRGTSPATAQGNSPATTAISVTLQPVGTTAAAIGGTTISVGGPAAIQQGTTISLVSQSSGLAIVVDQSTTQALSAVIAQGTTQALAAVISQAAPQAITTLPATQVLVQALGSTAAVVGGTTFSVGGPAVVEQGQTLSLISQSNGVAVVVDKSSTQAVLATAGAQVSYTPLGTTAAVIGGTTLSVGGSAVVEQGQTLSLISQSNGVAVVIGGSTTKALPSITSGASAQILTLGSQSAAQIITLPGQTIAAQLITLAGQTFTALPNTATPSAGVVVNGVTVKPGTATIINGETVSIQGTNLVIASGSVTTTKGLGSAIVNGLGGTASGSAGSAAYTGAAARTSSYSVWLTVCAAIGILLFIA